ncbi:MAG: Rv3654c family TadE-like protein [Actinomycetota bacterium]
MTEDGNAAIAVLGAAVVTFLVVMGLADIGIFFIARAGAQTAADAAALAAASELIPGGGQDPERQARRFATANGARLVKCACRPGAQAAEVKVEAAARFLLFSSGKQVPAVARAEVNLAGLQGPP